MWAKSQLAKGESGGSRNSRLCILACEHSPGLCVFVVQPLFGALALGKTWCSLRSDSGPRRFAHGRRVKGCCVTFVIHLAGQIRGQGNAILVTESLHSCNVGFLPVSDNAANVTRECRSAIGSIREISATKNTNRTDAAQGLCFQLSDMIHSVIISVP
jgi:hypothetical protein